MCEYRMFWVFFNSLPAFLCSPWRAWCVGDFSLPLCAAGEDHPQCFFAAFFLRNVIPFSSENVTWHYHSLFKDVLYINHISVITLNLKIVLLILLEDLC